MSLQMTWQAFRCSGGKSVLNNDHHQTVLLVEATNALNIESTGGIFVDCTYGRGGHSAAILDRLNKENGQLFAFDRDPEAVKDARERFVGDSRFEIFHENFNKLAETLKRVGQLGQVNGILLDLGVSSPQLDNADRGFSFQSGGPLDMRMDTTRGRTASEWLYDAEADDIADAIWRYGEERHSRRIARAIKSAQLNGPIETTNELAAIVARAIPGREKKKHPATRTFQAIRILINGELDAIQSILNQALDVLTTGGRLVVISFHSLEDRIVKHFIRDCERVASPVRGLPPPNTDWQQTLRTIGKAVRASDDEIAHNPRARSAIMRIAEKIV